MPENLLFDNERSDTVSPLSPYDEHLSKDRNALRLSFHDAIGISPKLGSLHLHSFNFTADSWKRNSKVVEELMGRLLFSMDPGIDDVLGEISPFFGIFKHAKSYKPGDLCVCSKDYFQV